jgi:GNAT superfamily N-acetyltransferase
MPEPQLTYRPMTPGDLGVAMYIGREAMDGLRRSQGGDPEPWTPHRPLTQAHLLRTDPGGAWIGEVNGVPCGYAMSFVRGKIWFLSQLFIQPDQQGHGLGQELLRRAQEYGRANGASISSVIASTSHVAHALYMRSGMFATAIAYRMTGPVEPLRRLPSVDASQKRIVDCSGWQDKIAALDSELFGAERRQDHAFYLQDNPTASFGLSRDGELLGYGYVVEDGAFIAPIAAREPGLQLPLLRMATDWLADHEIGIANMMVISANKTLMHVLLKAGWKSNAWTFLLTSEPFGQFDRYHPAGGALL